MDNIYNIIFFSVLSIIFVFLAIIVNVRNRKSIISKREEKDFIDKFVDKKTDQLKSIPGAMPARLYFMLLIVIPILLCIISFFIFKNYLVSFLLFLGGFFVPEIIVRTFEKKQKKDFEERYARALRQLSSSLRAGMTLQQAVSDLCECPFIHYEIKKEFKKIDSDIKLGISLVDAFQGMADRIPTNDVKDVASAIKMQNLVGGSEAESIEIITNNISSRIMLRKEIKTLFASVKMTVIGMDILPVLIIVFLLTTSPTYFEPIFDSVLGKLVFAVSIIMMIIGSYVDRRMTRKVKGVD